MVGVGLIGSGFMGKCHAVAWNAVGTVFPEAGRPRLVHLGEAGDELARRRGAELGFERASGNWRAVIADPEVDIVSITAPNRFHAEMALAAFRVVQEALTNASRYASGGRVEVRLSHREDGLDIAVDNEPGTATGLSGSGRGLVGLRQRVELYGGRLDAGPHASGWRVRAWLPLPGGGVR